MYKRMARLAGDLAEAVKALTFADRIAMAHRTNDADGDIGDAVRNLRSLHKAIVASGIHKDPMDEGYHNVRKENP